MPTPSANPPRVIRFRVKPPKYIRAKVAMIEIGMAVVIMAVLGMLRKNSNSTRMARAPP